MSDEGTQSGGQTPPELREAYDTLKSDFESLQENYDSLQANYRKLQATTTFNEAGLNQKHADLFLKVHGEAEITKDAVTQFAADYELPVSEGGGEGKPPEPTEQKPEEKGAAQNLAGMGGAGEAPVGGSATPQGQKMSVAEFQDLLAKDPTTAMQKYSDGLVEHADGNVAAEDAQRRGLIKG